MSAEHKTSIIGGGITSLYAALCALDSGQTNIHVYEASTRLGGKIKSLNMHGHTFNMGGEFIDSDDGRMIKLCNRLGLKLVECLDQKQYAFQGEGGKIHGDFFAQYAPVAQQIIRDREEMIAYSTGKRALHIKNISLAQYLKELKDREEFRSIPALIFQIALNSFAAEVGQTPENITAEQFVSETMRSTQKFLVSDCGYRVAGGTEAIIDALYQYLKSRGVVFHFTECLESAHKLPNGNIDLAFSSPHGTHHELSRTAIIGLPTYALAHIKGLDSFGLEPEVQEHLSKIQYANLVKFTLPTKIGASLPNVNLFGTDVQSYSPIPGYITFLCHNRHGMPQPALVKHHLGLYARSLNKPIEEIFVTSPGHIAFENPDKIACFSTPSPKYKRQTDQLLKQLLTLTDKGLGIVGTYFPLAGAIGFMECGLASVELAQERLYKIDGPSFFTDRFRISPEHSSSRTNNL